MNHVIPLSTPSVGPREEEAVLAALRSGWVAPAGPELEAFESELAAACGRSHAVALSSGTAALHLALLAHGVGSGDLVACASMTFAATANAIVYTGATPYFIDCDESGNMDPELLQSACDEIARTGGRFAAIVPVDLLGKVADYRTIETIARLHGAPVIADAAESLGAERAARPAGSWGDAAILSFNGNKIITTSGGGAVVCDDAAVARRVRYLSTQARQPAVHYEHTEIGFNYRMSNLLAALGRVQLTRLPEFLQSRRAHRDSYRRMCLTLAGVEIFGGKDRGDNCWLSAIVIDPEQAGFTAPQLSEALAASGIETRPLWKPMHVQPVFSDEQAYPRRCNGTAERFFRDGLVLPSGAGLAASEVGQVVEAINRFAKERSAASEMAGPSPVARRTAGAR